MTGQVKYDAKVEVKRKNRVFVKTKKKKKSYGRLVTS